LGLYTDEAETDESSKEFLLERQRNLLTLDHTLAVAEFRIAFKEACGIHNGIKFERWVSERECQNEYRLRRPFMGRRIGKFRPDGFVQYRHDGRLFSSFVEVDLATMSNIDGTMTSYPPLNITV